MDPKLLLEELSSLAFILTKFKFCSLYDFPFNLTSVTQLTKSLNCFDIESQFFYHFGMWYRSMIGVGHESRSLYYFEAQPSMCCVVLSPKLLYDHLGHPGISKLNFFVSKSPKVGSVIVTHVSWV